MIDYDELMSPIYKAIDEGFVYNEAGEADSYNTEKAAEAMIAMLQDKGIIDINIESPN